MNPNMGTSTRQLINGFLLREPGRTTVMLGVFSRKLRVELVTSYDPPFQTLGWNLPGL
jgi:hypothetical protein